MRDHSRKCVKAFIASGRREQIVDLEVSKYAKVARKIPANVDKSVRIRLVKQVSKSGEVRVYATSLLEGEQYSRTSIINLYKQRWGVEEAYKIRKARPDVVHFSGKTVHAVQQDFYARIVLISLTSILKAGIQPVLKTKVASQNTEKRTPVIHNSYAMAQTKRLLHKVYKQVEQITHWLKRFINPVKSAIEYSGKGQTNPGKADKGYNRVFAPNYKPT